MRFCATQAAQSQTAGAALRSFTLSLVWCFYVFQTSCNCRTNIKVEGSGLALLSWFDAIVGSLNLMLLASLASVFSVSVCFIQCEFGNRFEATLFFLLVQTSGRCTPGKVRVWL